MPQKSPLIAVLVLLLPPFLITEAYALKERAKWDTIILLPPDEQQKLFEVDNFVIAQYQGDVQAFIQAQAKQLEIASLSSGMSIVTSAGGGFVMTELFWKQKYKKLSWPWLLTIGLFGSYAVIDNIISLYKYRFTRTAGGNRVGHQYHLLGVITGSLSSVFLNC
jgi:hypothetical protein